MVGDRLTHRALALCQQAPQPPQMGIVAAVQQIIRQRHLGRHAGGNGAHQLQTLDLLRITPRRHPADAKARRRAFGKRRAMQDLAAAVERFGRQRPFRAEVQLTVNVIFNQRNLPVAQQRHQTLFVGLRQGGALRVLEVGHQPAGFDRILFHRLLQRVQIDTVLRMRGDRHRL